MLCLSLAAASCKTSTPGTGNKEPKSSASLSSWQSLPKNQTTLLSFYLTFRNGSIRPNSMLRNSQLNPRDLELSDKDRERLVTLLLAAAKEVKQMRESPTKNIAQQMAELVADGKATLVTPGMRREAIRNFQEDSRKELAKTRKLLNKDQLRRLEEQIEHPERYSYPMLTDEFRAKGIKGMTHTTPEGTFFIELSTLPEEKLKNGGEELIFKIFKRACADGFLSVAALSAVEATRLKALSKADMRAANWDALLNRWR